MESDAHQHKWVASLCWAGREENVLEGVRKQRSAYGC